MRKPDQEVREVVCSETGKPMSKIPAWIAEVNVKFVSDEARQKNPTPTALVEYDPPRRAPLQDAALEGMRVVTITEDGEEEVVTDFEDGAEDLDETEDEVDV